MAWRPVHDPDVLAALRTQLAMLLPAPIDPYQRKLKREMALTKMLIGTAHTTVNPDAPRTPPEQPTAINLPDYVPNDSAGKATWARDCPDFQTLFARLRRTPKGLTVTDEHIEALNFTITKQTSIRDLVPKISDSLPAEQYFDAIIKELQCPNSEAYRIVTRSTGPKDDPRRIRNLRKFYAGLEMMSSFYDISSDSYYTGVDTRKAHSTSPRPLYTGFRKSVGEQMPDVFRRETVLGLLQAIQFHFKTPVNQPRVQPYVKFGGLHCKIDPAYMVSASPKEEYKQRARITEGPLMSCFIRSGIELGKGSPEERKGKARADLTMEFATLLMVAQERHREGKKEKRGEGQWYVTKPRFGQKVEEQMITSYADVAEHAANIMTGKKSASPPSGLHSSTLDSSVENAAVLNWKGLKLSLPTWDPKTDYKAVGKAKGSDWDEVSKRYRCLSIPRRL